jgi:hypothetical protein
MGQHTMHAKVVTEVAVLSDRPDLEFFISTWLPGYVPHRTNDLAEALEIGQRGGVVLVDMAAAKHEVWFAALRDRGFDGPTVFLSPKDGMTIDLSERVVVTSPPSLSGLLAGLEAARSSRRAHRRRDRVAAVGMTALPGRSPRVVPSGTDKCSASGAQEEKASPVRGLSDAQRTEHGSARSRRMDRRHAAEATSLLRVLRRRLWSRSTRRSLTGAADAAVVWSSSQPAPLRSFYEAFREAEAEDGVRLRLRTSNGRVRVQTEEELFGKHPAPSRPPSV